MIFWAFPILWASLIFFLVLILICLSPGGVHIFNFSCEDSTGTKYSLKKMLYPYYLAIPVAVGGIFAIYTTKDSIVDLYNLSPNVPDGYDWLDPRDLLRFPAEQAKLEKDPDAGVTKVNLDDTTGSEAHFSLVFSDLSVSAEDKLLENASKAFSLKIDNRLDSIKECSNYRRDFTIKEKLPLMIFAEQSCNKSISTNKSKISLLSYWGYNSVKPLFNNYWDKNISDWDFCDTENSGSFINIYNKHVTDCRKLINVEGSEGRTNFAYIAKAIKERLSKNQPLNQAKNPFVSITIISDFAHEEFYKKHPHVPFASVQEHLFNLFQERYIKQVTLLVLPVSREQEHLDKKVHERVKQTIDLFTQEGKSRVRPVYLNDTFALNNLSCFFDALSETSTASTPDSCDVMNFYYTEHTGEDNKGRLKLEPVGFYGEPVYVKFYSPKQSGNDKAVLELDLPNLLPKLPLNRIYCCQVMPNHVVTCKLSDVTASTNGLYMDIYSPKTSQKRTVRLSMKPILPFFFSFFLIIFHVILLTSMCLCLSCITIFYAQHSRKRKWISYSSVAVSMVFNLTVLYHFFITYRTLVGNAELGTLLFIIIAILLVSTGLTIWWYRKFNKVIGPQISRLPASKSKPDGGIDSTQPTYPFL